MSLLQIHKIQDHFNKIYSEWEKILYPKGRKSESATLKVTLGCSTSVYHISKNQIIIYILDGDIEEYEDRIGTIDIKPGLRERTVGETELLHEMLHEMQFKELTKASVEGEKLYEEYKFKFFGSGHDAMFFSAVVEAAKLFGYDCRWLLNQL